jgi:hypothetical protein
MTAMVPELPAGTPEHRPRRRGRRIIVGAVCVVIAGGVLGWVVASNPFGGGGSPGAPGGNVDPTALATVSQHALSSQTQVAATLGYAGTYAVVNQSQGTVTSLPSVGQVITLGQVLYAVNGAPVILLYGATPTYRSLSEGDSGPDVAQLNYDLVALGEYSGGETTPTSDTFDAATVAGVKRLQAALGLTESGTVPLGQAVFLPTAARITALGTNTTVGGPAMPGGTILSATSPARVVTVALDAAQQSQIDVGDAVTITLPDNRTTPGTVTSVGTVAVTPPGNGAGSSTTPTITVLVTPTDPTATGSLDQAPVEVSITTASVKDAFVVPVSALLALSGGGYALEVVSVRGVHSLVPVNLGLFDDADGLVQVSGAGVAAGQRVVVPAT